MTEQRKKRVLVCPLEWGLGHITRDIPIIHLLREKGFEVLVAGGRHTAVIMKKEFPDIEVLPLACYRITYPANNKMALHLVRNYPRLQYCIWKEHRAMKKLVKDYSIDIVISDNRYGLWCKEAYTVFITHQVMVKMPSGLTFLEKTMFRMLKKMIVRFDRCWIPDISQFPSYAGDLSHKYSLNGKSEFIGVLSRFSLPDRMPVTDVPDDIDILCIISGPEPQRTRFEELLISQLGGTDQKVVMVTGQPSLTRETQHGNIRFYTHLDTGALRKAMVSARQIISRSGYSTIMDLIALGKSAILVPTPGQTEQEYLARWYNERKMFLCIPQDKFELEEALFTTGLYNWRYNVSDSESVQAAIEKLAERFETTT